MVKSHSQYDMETIRNVLVQDNHVHHIEYDVNNDIGGIQVLMAVNGLVNKTPFSKDRKNSTVISPNLLTQIGDMVYFLCPLYVV